VRLSGTPLVIVMSCVMVLDHLGLGVLPALQPVLIDEWQMSATEAGWVNGIFAVGYMLGVIMVVPFTDRMDAGPSFSPPIRFGSFRSLVLLFGQKGLPAPVCSDLLVVSPSPGPICQA